MIRILSKSLKGERTSSWFTVGLSILEVVFEIIIPLCMSNLIDQGIDQASMSKVWSWGITLLVFAILELVTGVLSARLSAKAASGYAANLRRDMYDNVQTFSFSNIDKFSTSSIVTRLTTDVTNIQNAYQMIIRMAIRGPVMMIFAMIVSFNINTQISLVFVAAIPVLAILLYFIIRAVNPIFKKVFKSYDDLNTVVQENVRGVRVVKSFNQEQHEINKFDAVSVRIYQGFAKGERLIAFNSPLMQVCMYACMILISYLGARGIVASGNNASLGLTTGELTALITYAMQILTSLMMLSMVFAMITISASSMSRVAEILAEKSDITNPENPVMTVKDGEVSFKDVSFRYASSAEKDVLADINLTIPSGSTLGILGGIGSAKSSLVQLIPRLYDVTNGAVTVGGVDVRSYDLDVLRTSVAMVLQKNELFSGTIRENLLWGNENATDEEIQDACRTACADEFIASLPDGLETVIAQGGTNVSGGQKQRLTIARALLKKPKVLILDDSTSAVDTKTDARIQQALSRSLPATTKIVIAQRVSSVMSADQIILMDNGRVSARGTHAELLATSAIYREIYQSQQKGAE